MSATARALTAMAGPAVAAQVELAKLAALGRTVLKLAGTTNTARAEVVIRAALAPAPRRPAAPVVDRAAAHRALEARAAESGVPVEVRFRAEANQARMTPEAYARAQGLDLARALAT